MSLEELMQIEVKTVFSASRYAQKVTDAPSSISIVGAEEIKHYGYRNLAEILRSVRGFHITYDRNYHYLGVRGFSRPGDFNTRILLLIDGVRVNDNIYHQAPIGTDFPLDIDLIERVEIVRGPSSSVYGTNAFLAVVNVITRPANDFGEAEISGGYGTFDAFKTRLTVGREVKDWRFVASGSWEESDGDERLFFPEFNDPASNNGVAEGLDDERGHSGFARLSWRDLTLQAVYSQREKAVPTAAYEMIFNDPRAAASDRHYFLDLKYEHLFPGRLGILARVNYNGYYYRGDYPLDHADYQSDPDAEPLPVLNRDRSKGRWWGVETQAVKEWDRHRVTVGGEFRHDIDRIQKNFDLAPFASYLDSKRDSSFWALYLQDEFRLLPQVSISAGARYDYYTTFGGTLNPRVALIYTPREQTAFKLIYGEAFRAPNAYELYYGDGDIFQKANSDLSPEEIRTWEFVYEQYFGHHLRSSISAFYHVIDDLITVQVDPADGLQQFRNSGRADAQGAEFELAGKWQGGVQGRASYAYIRAEDDRTGEKLTNSPTHLAKVNLVLPLIGELLLGGVEVQYTGERKTLQGNRTDDFFLTNVTLFSENAVPGLELSASVYNLFDREYADPGSNEHRQDAIAQDGRTYRLKMTYRF